LVLNIEINMRELTRKARHTTILDSGHFWFLQIKPFPVELIQRKHNLRLVSGPCQASKFENLQRQNTKYQTSCVSGFDIHAYLVSITHIHAYIHTHTTSIHMHVYAHLYTDWKSQQQCLNASSNIIDAHTYPYTYACIYIYICIYTYVHNLQRVCSRCVRWCQTNTCVMYTPAHALVHRTPVPKCTQNSLPKNAHIYIHTQI